MNRIPVNQQIRELGLPPLPASATQAPPIRTPALVNQAKSTNSIGRVATISRLNQVLKSYSAEQIDQVLCQADAAKRELVLESLLTRARENI